MAYGVHYMKQLFMAQLMKSWSWQNATQKRCMKNVLEKFHVQLHIYVFLKFSNGL